MASIPERHPITGAQFTARTSTMKSIIAGPDPPKRVRLYSSSLLSTGAQPRARLKTSLTILLRSLLPSSSFFFAILFCKMIHEFIQKQPKMKISKALGLFFPSKHASFLIFQRDQSTALQPTVSIFLLSLLKSGSQ